MAHSDMFLIQKKMLTLICGMFSTGLKWRNELDTQKLSFSCKLCFTSSKTRTRSDCASVILLVCVDKRRLFCYWIWRTVWCKHYNTTSVFCSEFEATSALVQGSANSGSRRKFLSRDLPLWVANQFIFAL